MTQKLLFIIGILLLAGCGTSFKKLMHGGEVSQERFFETIPFDFESGLPLVKVEIQGETYQFLFDTGAPNVISKELAEQIEFKLISKNKINDSQGNSNIQKTILIESIKIGDIAFLNTGAIIIDYNKVFEMRCFEIDGILGANLMSKAAWSIDYEESEISFTEKVENFNVPDSAYHINFIPKVNQRTPTINVKVNEHTVNKITFDTGATGDLQLKGTAYGGDLKNHKSISSTGGTSTGVYGRSGAETRSTFAVIDTLAMGDLKMTGQIVEFEDKGSMILGNRFLKNYKVILDWKKNDIFLLEREKYDFSTFKGFGFYPRFKDNKLVVSAVFENSMASDLGIKIDDQLAVVNGVVYDPTSDKMGCQLLLEKPFRELDTMHVTIIREEEVFDFMIPRQVLLDAEKGS